MSLTEEKIISIKTFKYNPIFPLLMTEAKDLQKGSWIVHGGELFQVKRKEVVACGTHSHSKTKIFIEPLAGGGEKSLTLTHHEKVEEADIRKKTAQVISKFQNKIQIMDPVSYETLDAEVDEELLSTINEGDEVIFIDYNGVIKVLEKK